jgi:hypothetical protein
VEFYGPLVVIKGGLSPSGKRGLTGPSKERCDKIFSKIPALSLFV